MDTPTAPASPPRILSLLPSATEIVGALGLAHALVGVTHECDVCPDQAGLEAVLARGGLRVTRSQFDPHSLDQGAIHAAVQASLVQGASLYELREDLLAELRPTVVLTQALCAVCAPDYADVAAACRRLGEALAGPDSALVPGSAPLVVATGSAPLGSSPRSAPVVLSLEPGDLQGVGSSFRAVAEACGVPERGLALEREFHAQLKQLREATYSQRPPRVLLLEWLDPPFDGGHWVPGQISAAGAVAASNISAAGAVSASNISAAGAVSASNISAAGAVAASKTEGGKSRALSWDEVEAADADVVLVACCGFDLARNLADAQRLLCAQTAEGARFRALPAVRQGRVYALDGNRYFARPSPSLVPGAAALARCAHDGDEEICRRLEALPFLPAEGSAWQRVMPVQTVWAPAAPVPGALVPATPAPAAASHGPWALHEAACAEGRRTYVDPTTGFTVFTRLGLEARGRCCGCGCRHCPFAHANVADKAAKIQQPAVLHRPARPAPGPVTVLFWSGGKDSFLTLRALQAAPSPDRVVLLTTFDASTRVVAHQEIPVGTIVRQAQALDLELVGVPLHTGTPYLERVEAGLAVLRRSGVFIAGLAFGDLHLEHIRDWREQALARLGIPLSYPVWQRPYDALLADLLASGVPCEITATGHPLVAPVGRRFDHELVRDAQAAGLDAFGENGEFHTVARVWER